MAAVELDAILVWGREVPPELVDVQPGEIPIGVAYDASEALWVPHGPTVRVPSQTPWCHRNHESQW